MSSLRSSRGPRSAAGFEADASGELVDHDAFLATTAGFLLRFSGPRTLTVRSSDPAFLPFLRYKYLYLTSDQGRGNDCVLELVLLACQQKRSFPSRGPCALTEFEDSCPADASVARAYLLFSLTPLSTLRRSQQVRSVS